MTFTLVSHLRENLSSLVIAKAENRMKEEKERERIALEVCRHPLSCLPLFNVVISHQEEDARTRGTPVTIQSFKVWKAKFDLEMAAKKAREDDEKLKALSPKEREEWKRASTRLSGGSYNTPVGDRSFTIPQGRQLFERDKTLEEDALLEEGTVSVDISQYERIKTDEDEDEDDRITFSDSD